MHFTIYKKRGERNVPNQVCGKSASCICCVENGKVLTATVIKSEFTGSKINHIELNIGLWEIHNRTSLHPVITVRLLRNAKDLSEWLLFCSLKNYEKKTLFPKNTVKAGLLLGMYNTLTYVNQYYEPNYLFIKNWLSSRPGFLKLWHIVDPLKQYLHLCDFSSLPASGQVIEKCSSAYCCKSLIRQCSDSKNWNSFTTFLHLQ
jgi:hypothetical protein